MSFGSLSDCTYHRAAQVSVGSFGSALTVYIDDGKEYALKSLSVKSLKKTAAKTKKVTMMSHHVLLGYWM
jgi:hypothetical protein